MTQETAHRINVAQHCPCGAAATVTFDTRSLWVIPAFDCITRDADRSCGHPGHLDAAALRMLCDGRYPVAARPL
jgi:hypothetical protein